MYLDHFGLLRKPFELTPDPAFLHLSKKHSLALHLLEYGVYEQTGITVISGEVGSGKTTLVQHLLNTMDHAKITVGLINNTHESIGDLTQWIALALNINIESIEKATLYRKIQDFVIAEYAAGKRVLLIVDEAQNMSASSLEQLRLFSNINGNSDFLLQILLVGQPELSALLGDPKLAQVAQRVSVEYHLESLDWNETRNYVLHRLKIAGADSAIFSDDAIGAIYYQSGGIPRLINTLSDYALVHAYAKNENTVTLETAMEVLRSRKIGGVNRHKTKREQEEIIRHRILERCGMDISSHPERSDNLFEETITPNIQ